jgi:hypothetical protein
MKYDPHYWRDFLIIFLLITGLATLLFLLISA